MYVQQLLRCAQRPQKKNIAKPPGAMERISASQTAWKLSLDGGLALLIPRHFETLRKESWNTST